MISSFVRAQGAVRRNHLVRSIGESAVNTAMSRGEWVSPWPGVLVEASRRADPLALVAGALVFAGEQAVVTGRTAAWLHGFTAVEPLPVHLAVPYGHWLRARDGLVAHNGRGLEDDQVLLHELPVLCAERVLADLLCRDRAEDAFAVLDQALQVADDPEGLRERVRTRIAARADPRGRRRGVVLLNLGTGKALSPPESYLHLRLVDLGFPPPEINAEIADGVGRVLFLLDFAWTRYRIVVEYDGHVPHLGREWADAERQWELEKRGYIVIRATSADLRDVTRVQRELAEAFRRRGVPLRSQPGLVSARRHRERP
jgi:hypothetical protein